MNSQNWAEKDIDRGIKYLADHEEEALTETILPADDHTTILVPSGLPVYGANITGFFMMAPIMVFIVIIILFPIRILWSTQGLPVTTVIMSLVCLLLAWGLIKVFQLMLKNRDLFPRCYFVTLGHQGIAMHFTRLHFPFHPPRQSILWKKLKTVQRSKTLFLPALFFGSPWVTVIEVISTNGEKIFIPFRLPPDKFHATETEIKSLIANKISK